MAFLAVLREGFETVGLPARDVPGQRQRGQRRRSAPSSASWLRLALGYAIYRGGVRLNLARFFTLTSVVLVVVAAGLLMTAAHTAHEAGWLNLGQAQALDLTWLVRPGTPWSALRHRRARHPAAPRRSSRSSSGRSTSSRCSSSSCAPRPPTATTRPGVDDRPLPAPDPRRAHPPATDATSMLTAARTRRAPPRPQGLTRRQRWSPLAAAVAAARLRLRGPTRRGRRPGHRRRSPHGHRSSFTDDGCAPSPATVPRRPINFEMTQHGRRARSPRPR